MIKIKKQDTSKKTFNMKIDKKVLMKNVQKFGGWLSAMIMPIIGIIIGWGILTAFFLDTGWTPVAVINDYLIGNIINYLLPIMIGFYAGKLVHGDRGGVIASFVVFGVIVGNQFNPGWWEGASATPQFLGAMMVGPLAAYILKLFDKLLENRIRSGFEMLVNNFSLAIIGLSLCLAAFFGFPWVINAISWVLMKIVYGLVSANLIFLSALVVEPAKILFLNNAINHGVFTPLGIQMAADTGRSILFLLESNPGSGLGILVATALFDKKSRGQATGATVIQFFGGIHEVYFPFVLMRPILIIALLSGGLAGDAMFQIFDAGLKAPASPGSILAIFAMADSEWMNYLGISLGVLVSFAVSLGVGTLLFIIMNKRHKGQSVSLEEAQQKTIDLKGKESKYIRKIDKTEKLEKIEGTHKPENLKNIKLVIFACEAGMGSSAMGAGILRKKFKQAELDIEVKNFPIKELPENAEFVITQESLTELAKSKAPHSIHKSISNFLDGKFYDEIVEEFKKEINHE